MNALSPTLSHAPHIVGCLYSQRRLIWNITFYWSFSDLRCCYIADTVIKTCDT